MRIRKSASRLLGSAYSTSTAPPVDAAPPFDLLPPPHLASCSASESRDSGGFSTPSAPSLEPCELSRSPWDLIAELSLSDPPQVEDDILDKYFVHVTTRTSWLFSATMPAASAKKRKKKKKKLAAACRDSSQLRRDVVKKPAVTSKEKERQAKKKAKVKKEEGQDGGAPGWTCKKNDGKQWHCNRPVSQPNTLCEYHFVQKRSYLNPDFEFPSAEKLEAEPTPVPVAAAASKSSTSNKPRKKKKKKPGSSFSATEGFYYYAGFGPSRTKRQCRSGGMNEAVPGKQEENDDHAKDVSPSQAEVDEGHDDTNGNGTSARDDAIAGMDEESSDYDFDGLSGHSMNGNGDTEAIDGDGRRKIQSKRWRKPVKARSLKSLI